MTDKKSTNNEVPKTEMDVECFILPRRVEKALAALQAHLWDDEKADYFGRAAKERKGHIFDSLIILEAWQSCPQGRLRVPRKAR